MNDVLRDERERGWFHLDNAIIDEYLPKIGPIAFAVYASIVRHADRAGNAFPSYTKLQEELGTGRKQIAAAIRVIVDAGLITFTTEKEEGRQKKNIYHVVTPKGGVLEKLVSERNQSLRETDSGFSPTPKVVSQRNSNNTQLTRPIEKDPIGVASQPRATPKTTLATFQPDEKDIAEAIAAGVPLERIPFETEQWRDYHDEKGTNIKGFPASWRRWMRNAPSFNRPRGSPPTNGHRPVTFDEQRELNNARHSAEFDAILNGSRQHGQAGFHGTDGPPRRGLPGGDIGSDASGLLPRLPEDPER